MSFYSLLEQLRKNYIDDKFESGGLIFGEEWIKETKLKKCIITTHLTSKTIIKAVQEKAGLIITIHSPSFFTQKNTLRREKMELLKILFENNIGIYSLGKRWLTSTEGGFDYFLQLLDFNYTKEVSIDYLTRNNELRTIRGVLGERKRKIKLKNLVQLIYQNTQNELRYFGYNELDVQKIAIFSRVNEEAIQEILDESSIDVLIVDELSYEALLEIHIYKKPVVILNRKTLEEITLAAIRRKLMEDIGRDLPELTVHKEEEFGSRYPNNDD